MIRTCCSVFLIFFIFAKCNIVFVGPNGSDQPFCGNDTANPCLTITQAFNVGATWVKMLPGTYNQAGNLALKIPSSPTLLTLSGDTDKPEDVIIDGRGSFEIINELQANFAIRAITLQNGVPCIKIAPLNYSFSISKCIFQNCIGTSGGVLLNGTHHEASSVQITDSLFFNNTGGGATVLLSNNPTNSYIKTTVFISNIAARNSNKYGGGASISGWMDILSSTFESNVADYGGGLALTSFHGELKELVLTINTAFSNGGGLFVSNSSLVASLITCGENTAESGSGLFINASVVQLNISVFRDNVASHLGGIFALDSKGTLTNVSVIFNRLTGTSNYGAGLFLEASEFTFPNSNFRDNTVIGSTRSTFSNNFYCDTTSFLRGYCQSCCDFNSYESCLNETHGGVVWDSIRPDQLCIGTDNAEQCPCAAPTSQNLQGLRNLVAFLVFALITSVALLILVWYFKWSTRRAELKQEYSPIH